MWVGRGPCLTYQPMYLSEAHTGRSWVPRWAAFPDRLVSAVELRGQTSCPHHEQLLGATPEDPASPRPQGQLCVP